MDYSLWGHRESDTVERAPPKDSMRNIGLSWEGDQALWEQEETSLSSWDC